MYFTYTDLIIILLIWTAIDFVFAHYRAKRISKIRTESYTKGREDFRKALIEEVERRKNIEGKKDAQINE